MHPPSLLRAIRMLLATGTLLGIVSAARANGSRLPDQDAQATARGGAFAATADNGSAIYYNPAGITQLDGQQVLVESYILQPHADYTSPSGQHASVKQQTFLVPQLYATWTPANSPLSYGLGVYETFGLSSEWPGNTGFETLATINKITYLTVAPTLAWKVSDQLSLGAGLQINRAEANLNRTIGYVPGDEFHYEGGATSFGYNLGLLWKITPQNVVGLSYKSQATSKFSGTAELIPFAPPEHATASFPFPDDFEVSYSWRPTPAWNFETGVDWTDWSKLQTVVLQKASGPVPLVFNWKSSYYYLLGATRYLADGWQVSAGYTYSGNSSPEAGFNPAIVDMSRNLGTFGFGRTLGAFSWNLAYQHGFHATRTISQGAPSMVGETADGTYSTSTDALSLSFRYTF